MGMDAAASSGTKLTPLIITLQFSIGDDHDILHRVYDPILIEYKKIYLMNKIINRKSKYRYHSLGVTFFRILPTSRGHCCSIIFTSRMFSVFHDRWI